MKTEAKFPPNEHPYYREWLEQEGYLKKLLDDACKEIARLSTEIPKENSKKSVELTLPVGKWNNRMRGE